MQGCHGRALQQVSAFRCRGDILFSCHFFHTGLSSADVSFRSRVNVFESPEPSLGLSRSRAFCIVDVCHRNTRRSQHHRDEALDNDSMNFFIVHPV